MTKRLEGKNAIITGAASGIGRASALLFAENGAKVTIFDQSAQGLEETAAMMREAGYPVVSVTGDAGSEEDVKKLVEAGVKAHGTPNVFFANAGIAGPPAPVIEETLEIWQATLRVNLIGPFLAIKTVAPLMIKEGKGSIVLTASVAGLRSAAGPSAYSASKAGVISLAQTSACQLAPSGIRVNAICPGLIETGMTKPIFDWAKASGKEQRLGRHCPMHRAGQPREIATMAVFLASDESSYVTGQAFPVDGGLSATHSFSPGRVI